MAILIATGMTNHEIGERLAISERTVDAHVTNVFNRLGFHRRVEVACWVGVLATLAQLCS